ncbi:MAG: bifunctional folylpolyglutamate synthase/dihydrofolate synthase [Lachnospiraceae bacterium]|nr:bifunctional folylpolyglutamate synthase/dihydrofolate synthase [Lachnospiraceae bacterium]
MSQISLSDKKRGSKSYAKYLECERYILSIPRFSAKKHSLADLRDFLNELGNPHKGKKIIHVAGTNGKGSVCAYLHAILRASGLTAGLFTSPHLVEMRERIKINDRIIALEEFIWAFETVKEKIKDFHPTFFEFLFLMAMLCFGKTKLQYLILETGLGGRLDATNVIDEKILTIITPVSYDHMEYLGTALGQIAAEKAGIMRPGVTLLTASQKAEVLGVLKEKAAENDVPIVPINKNAIKINKITSKSIDFSYQYRYDIVVRILLMTKALYQAENASLAIHAALCLGDDCVSTDSITSGLGQAVWPGRMEEIAPDIIIDAAHNEAGILAFIESVRLIPRKGRKFLLFGGAKDKQSQKIVAIIKEAKLFDEIIACQMNNPRTLLKGDLAELFPPGQIFTNVESGLASLLKQKQAGDLIFITGSLFLYSDLKLLLADEVTDD